MKERLKSLLDVLNERRDQILETYLGALENYDGHRSADCAMMLHDIDRHITNVHLELKRIGAVNIINRSNGKEEIHV